MQTTELAERIDGEVLEPGDDGFDEARSVFNGRFARRPALIARCHQSDDVRAAVGFAREEGLTLSVKGGGHAYAGNTVAEGGLLIDLSPMNDIRVDADNRTVDVGGGVTCGEMDAATQPHGLAAVTPTASTIGVAGAALGGGEGWLSRKYGMALDNLISAEVVTADGRQLRASDDENPELFWALRGAGANFGVVTSLRFRLHEVGPDVLFGQVIYPFDRADELLRFYRDFMADAPEELMCGPFIMRIPPMEPFPDAFHGEMALAFIFCHLDPSATDAVQPLREQGESILDAVAPMPYLAVQQSFDAGSPKGERYYSKAQNLDQLSDAAVDTMVEHGANHRGDFTIAYLFPADGAIARVDPSATAFPCRGGGFDFHILAGWTDPGSDEAVMAWAAGFNDAMADHATGGVYVNLVADDEDDRIPAAYGRNHRRLAQLKAEWDPDNVFSGNYNIVPAP